MKDPVIRIRLISVGVLMFAVLLLTRLYFVQIVAGQEFAERADRQYARPIGNVFERGTIFFQAKDTTLMAAASLKVGYIIALNPKLIEDAEKTYTELSKFIEIDRENFFAKVNKTTDPYEEIARRVEPETAEKITNLELPGVNAYKEKWRFYPGEDLASHVLGFVGFKGEDYGGRYGLEAQFEDTLARADEKLYVNFFAEVFSDIKQSFDEDATKMRRKKETS
jgi:cell division protein FtsI/penicillin-binding protein 2